METHSSVSINLLLKRPTSLPLPLICRGWHTLGPFVTQAASYMRVGFTSANLERQMACFPTPLNNCRSLFVKLLQRTAVCENPVGQGRNVKRIGSYSVSPPPFFSVLYSSHALPLFICLDNGLCRPGTISSLLAQKSLHIITGCFLGKDIRNCI